MTPWKIMIVEDDEAYRNAIRIALSATPEYHVETANDGETALARLAHEHFDLVILDLTLPGMDGYSLCANLRLNATTANIGIIILTGRFGIDDKLTGFSLGAGDFITKPV